MDDHPTGKTKTSPLMAQIASESIGMAIESSDAAGWKDIADDLRKAWKQASARWRQIERG